MKHEHQTEVLDPQKMIKKKVRRATLICEGLMKFNANELRQLLNEVGLNARKELQEPGSFLSHALLWNDNHAERDRIIDILLDFGADLLEEDSAGQNPPLLFYFFDKNKEVSEPLREKAAALARQQIGGLSMSPDQWLDNETSKGVKRRQIIQGEIYDQSLIQLLSPAEFSSEEVKIDSLTEDEEFHSMSIHVPDNESSCYESAADEDFSTEMPCSKNPALNASQSPKTSLIQPVRLTM